MATLNLSSYSAMQSGSVLGYSASQGLSAFKDASAATNAGYSSFGSAVTSNGTNWVINLGPTATIAGTDLEKVITAIDGSGLGSGTLSVTGNANVVSVIGAAGNDFVQGTFASSAVINVAGGDDVVSVKSQVGMVNLGDGDNQFISKYTGTAGAASVTAVSSVLGGAGNDIVSIAASAGVISLGGGANQVKVAGNVTSVYTEGGADFISIHGSAANIYTGAGNDTVFLGELLAGSQTLNTSDGNDTVSVGSADANSKIDLGAGSDSMTAVSLGSGATVLGGEGDETVSVGTATGSIVDLGAGTDQITVLTADGVNIDLGAGDNTVYIDQATGNQSTIKAGNGTDSVSITYAGVNLDVDLGAGNNKLVIDEVATGVNAAFVSDGTDDISLGTVGNGADFSLYGGNDSLRILTGPTETGTVMATGANDANLVSLGSGKLSHVELGGGNDTLILPTLYGSVNAGGTTSNVPGYVDMGDGNDSISLFAVDDGVISLGNGNDTLIITNSVDNVSIYGDYDSITGGNDRMTVLGNANVVDLGSGNDTITLTQLVNSGSITAASGDNLVSVGTVGNNTTLVTGSGKDTIDIGTLQNSVSIATGDEADSINVVASGTMVTLNSGAGNDTLVVDKAHDVYLGDGTDSLALTTFEGGRLSLADDTTDIGNDRVMIGTALGGTVTGGAGDQIVSVRNGALNSVDLGAGDDSLMVPTIKSGSSVNMGAEDDLLLASNVDDSVTINMGSGLDAVSITKARENLTVDMGTSEDSLAIGYVEGGANISLGGADDTLVVQHLEGANIDLGDGADDMYVSIKSGVVDTVNAGQGDDFIDVYGLAGGASSTLSMDLGLGDDTFVSADLNDTELHLTAGNGSDSISINNVGTNSTIDLGAGTNSLYATMYGGATGATITGGAYADHVSLLADADFIDGVINLGEGANEFAAATLMSGILTTGSGNDSVSIGTSEGTSISVGDGNNIVTLGSYATTTDVATSDVVTFGSGNDTISVQAYMSDTTIVGGAGNDSATIAHAYNSTLDFGAGKDTVVLADYEGSSITGGSDADVFSLSNAADQGTAVITDFEFAKDLLVVGTTPTTDTFLYDGEVSLAGGSAARINSSLGYYGVTAGTDAVLAKNSTVSPENYVWTGENGVMVNGMAGTYSSVQMVMMGTTNDSLGGVDTLVGGTKNDTLIAGVGDYVYGGTGNDTIVLGTKDASTREFVGVSSDNSTDTVAGFDTGLGATDDAIYFFNSNLGQVKSATTGADNFKMAVGTSALVLDGVTDTDVELVLSENGQDAKTAVVVGGTYAVTSTADIADYYYSATNSSVSALDFSKVGENLLIDLGNSGIVGDDNTHFIGSFSTVAGGSDKTKILGAGGYNETLVATAGDTSLWGGGASSDLMKGDTDATTTYFYGNGNGLDTIVGFNTGISQDTVIADRVAFYSYDQLKNVTRDSAGNVVLEYAGESNRLTITGVSDEETIVQFTLDGETNHAAKIGQYNTVNAFNYDAAVDTYIGSVKNDTIVVGSDVDVATQMYLDGSAGKSYLGIDIIDASATAVDFGVAGQGTTDETLIGGTGNNTLYGGSGASNDVLQGNSTSGASTTFFFGLGDGHDTIAASGAGDKVMAYNVSQENIASVSMDEKGNATATLTDGSSLTVTGLSSSTVTTFVMGGDNTTWTYQNGSWIHTQN